MSNPPPTTQRPSKPVHSADEGPSTSAFPSLLRAHTAQLNSLATTAALLATASFDHSTYLDLEIAIIDNKFDYKLYDKRNSYDFHIVRFPYRKSNIPSKVFYGSIGA